MKKNKKMTLKDLISPSAYEQVESMKKFILDVLEDWHEMGSLDGFDLHDIAVKHKILIPHTVYAPCVEDGCKCSEVYDSDEFKAGATCYRVADWLDRAAEQRNDKESGTCPFCNGQGWRLYDWGNKVCRNCNGTGHL